MHFCGLLRIEGGIFKIQLKPKITNICETIKFMTWLPKQDLLKCLSKNNSVIEKSSADISNQSEQQNNKEIIELLQEQNKLLIEENKSKTTIIEMLVESQNK